VAIAPIAGDPALLALIGQVERRAEQVRQAAPHIAWPCQKGCDACCRRLAAQPLLTRAEWTLLQQGIAGLPPAEAVAVAKRVLALPCAGPMVCPFLHPAAGACLVYPQRPVACRAFGFYVERDGGLYCPGIAHRVAGGEFNDVVWGNGSALQDRLAAAAGPPRPLQEWWTLQCP
jgi:uncharacterized protein